jgi:multidrug efflux pump subunit AcrB
VQPLQLGPLIEWPVQYRISGPDVQTLQRLTYQIADIVASSPDTRNINFDWIEPIRAIRVRVDQAKVRQIGISSEDLAPLLNTVTSASRSPRFVTRCIWLTWWRVRRPRTAPHWRPFAVCGSP